tara:strand:- start:3329 stop:4201 length:873 start_codon:yes stop_codon:yes gene_type:complete
MNKVLVLGGSGFLGQYLAEELLKRKYDVIIADIKEPKIDCKYFKCDVLVEKDIVKLFSNYSFDIVYNLSAFANLDKAIENPVLTMNINLLSNMKIIEKCIETNVKKFIYASSAYAMSNKGSFYGISKLASEKVLEEYNKRYNFNFLILRYGSVYSEKDYENNYIFKVVKEAISTGKILHNGDGNEFREYIHALDAAKLSVDVLEDDNFLNKHVILTGSQKIKRSDLFSMINEIYNKEIKIILKNDDYNINHYKYTPYSFQASISEKLTPNPQIDLGQGILECIRVVDENK